MNAQTVEILNANRHQIGGAHYQAPFQHWDMIENHGVGYLEAAASKYLTRSKVDPIEDTEKAVHYLEKLVNLHDENGRKPRGWEPTLGMRHYLDLNKVMDQRKRDAITLMCSCWKRDDLLHAIVLTSDLLAEMKAAATPSNPVRTADILPFVPAAPVVDPDAVLAVDQERGKAPLPAQRRTLAARFEDQGDGVLRSVAVPVLPRFAASLGIDDFARVPPDVQAKYYWCATAGEYVLQSQYK